MESLALLLKKAAAYLCFEFRPKTRTVVFNSYRNRRFDFNARYLFEHMIKGQSDCLFVIDDEHLRTELEAQFGNSFISSRTWSGLREIFRSGCWVTSTGMPVRIPFASRKREVINLWHGIPLKKVGILEQNIPVVNKLVLKYVYRDNYTCITATSNSVAEVMSDSFLCPLERVKIFGLPQNDLLYKPIPLSDFHEGLKEVNLNTRFKILYCPTFRGNTATKLFPFTDFNAQKLHDYLEEADCAIAIRQHPLDIAHEDATYFSDRCFPLNPDIVPDIAAVLGQFDVVITDYSSIYLDFLLLSKPVLFLPYDLQEYVETRGLNFDYDEVTPGPKPVKFSCFLSEISSLLTQPEYFLHERNRVRRFFHEIDGASCDRIESYIESKLVGPVSNQ